MTRVAIGAVLLTTLLLASGGAAASSLDARAVVEAFLERLARVQIADLVVDQDVTLYHPDGRRAPFDARQRLLMKAPGRQRFEQTLEGRREIRLVVGDHVWIRDGDGRTFEAPQTTPAHDPLRLLFVEGRRAEDVLAEWRALGIRDDVSHAAEASGRAVTVIGAARGDRESPAVWLDPEFGVVRFVTRERLPRGSALVDVTLREHRRLPQGFFFPYRQEIFVDGRLAVLVIVRSVAANTHLADDLFDPETLRRTR